MKIMFIVETGHGIGHISRCLSLAEEFKERGHKFLFLAERGKGIEKIKYNKTILPQNIDPREKENIVLKSANKFKPEIFISDLLKPNENYIKRLKEKGIITVSIYDFILKPPKNYDIVINPNPIIKFRKKNRFSGTMYMPMKKCFYEKRKKYSIRKKCRNVLISMGGSDPQNQTETTLRKISEIRDISTTVVIGPVFKNKTKIKNLSKALNVIIIENASNEKICDLMANTDIAITTAGNTMYELACLGTPNIVVCNHENHLNAANSFEKRGAVINLGMIPSGEKIKKAVERLIDDYGKRKKLSMSARKLVDGKGSKRIKKHIMEVFNESIGNSGPSR
jgi:spore coat polysaccharide biosynthesis predicted glycosyltransferase SpsG